MRNHGQGTKTSDATGEIFSSPYQEREREREREAIMSPTQMDLPLFQGIQDTRTDTLQIPVFRLQPVLLQSRNVLQPNENEILKIISDLGVPPWSGDHLFRLSSSSTEEFG